MKNIILLLTLIAIQSCMTAQKKLNPAVYYKNDICFKYDGKEFCGVGVLPKENEYKIKVMSHGSLDLFVLETCHREVTSTRPDSGIFRKDGNVTITYTPTLEENRPCPLYFSAYNRDGKHAQGVIAFESSSLKLKSKMYCNGEVLNFTGTSICESKDGLLQKITFPEKVKNPITVSGTTDRSVKCQDISSKDGLTFEFKISNRECNYVFQAIESKEKHIMYTIGHEDIPIRN